METKALTDVLAERENQRAKWGDGHDDEHGDGALADVAAGMASKTPGVADYIHANGGPAWGAPLRRKHRGDRRRQLVIAGALVLAEIERIDRDM